MRTMTHRNFKIAIAAILVMFLSFSHMVASEVDAETSLLEGIALKDKTHVYESTNQNSNVLRSYNHGTVLLYQYHNSSWYKAIVFVNGDKKTGYIYSGDVETASDNRKTVQGVALKDRTKVYSRASKNAHSPRSYPQGQVLYYEENYTSNWNKAFIFRNGKKENVYIHVDDIETIVDNQETLKGVAEKNPTPIYSRASKGSSTIRSYDQGSVLYYKTFTSSWYEALVYVNGKARTGYIHRDDVDNLVRDQKTVNGVAKDRTNVYSKASKNSTALRSYSTGTSLIYKTFSSEWYEARIYINGKARTGYIHKSDVDTKLSEQTTLRGIAQKGRTNVYTSLSRDAGVLRSYSEGTVLMYKTLSENWNEAVVFVNGKKRTGYINVADVENAYPTQERLQGKANKSRIYVYSKPSKNASTLRYYNRTPVINLSTFSKNWYEVNVTVNGATKKGYIHTDDVNTDTVIEETTSYDKHFDDLVDIWYSKSPQIWKNGGFVHATRDEVAYYANPNNFSDRNAKSFFQYLVLSQPTGINAKEVNENILYNKGSLKGTGGAFYQAGRTHSVNELYLIAHALHETGNGQSELASGVKYNGKTVYNMYGFGAYDNCAVDCGAKFAYDNGWFTPEDAVIGGAKFIAEEYIHVGQDTLYKMRWNPDKPGHHQYATDVNWALAQTHSIANLYSMIDNYTLFFDIPSYDGAPSKGSGSDIASYPSKTTGVTTANVNFRQKPTTDSSAIETINNGSEVKLLGYASGQSVNNNDIWYKVEYNGNTGYLHSDYVEPTNLLQVVGIETSLNIRNAPVTGDVIGSLKNRTYISAVVDSDGKLVKDGIWYKVNLLDSNGTGWVSGDYINEIK